MLLFVSKQYIDLNLKLCGRRLSNTKVWKKSLLLGPLNSVGSICQPCCVKQPLGNILTKILLLHCNISVDGIDSKPDVSLSRTYKGWKKGQLPRKENAINAGLFLKCLLQARTDVDLDHDPSFYF